MKRKMIILTGEGIECEKESLRFFSLPAFETEARFAPVPKILSGALDPLSDLRAGDWVFIPGGFSFADHFGSGKLLAYQLRSKGFLDECLKRGLNLMGVCNGFQVLVETGLFGEGVSLEPNEVEDLRTGQSHRPGFVNRWVKCRMADFLGARDILLPVRHGEGRLVRKTPSWSQGVQSFLTYADDSFSNGSVEQCAGLVAKRQKSSVWGLMPHPEIALRPTDRPDTLPLESAGSSVSQISLAQSPGDGVELVKAILDEGRQYA